MHKHLLADVARAIDFIKKCSATQNACEAVHSKVNFLTLDKTKDLGNKLAALAQFWAEISHIFWALYD